VVPDEPHPATRVEGALGVHLGELPEVAARVDERPQVVLTEDKHERRSRDRVLPPTFGAVDQSPIKFLPRSLADLIRQTAVPPHLRGMVH
jgi:hypothetical protein